MTTGIFTTTNFTDDLAKKSFASMITRLMPNGNAPLFGMTSMTTDETAVQVEHGFFSKTMIFPELTMSAQASAVATTLTVTDTTNILPGMIMRVESTGENLIVDTVVSGTSVTVTRSVGTVAGAIIIDTANLYQVGNAFAEASDRPIANNIIPVRVTNLTQIFRNTWSISGSADATSVIAGNSTDAESRQDCAAFHAADIEKTIFFGQKSQGTRDGQPFRTAGGLISMIEDPSFYPPIYGGSTNANDTGGASTNWSQLLGYLDPCFNQATDPRGSNERVLFVGGQAKLVINEIGRLNGTYQLMDGQTNFGLDFSTLTLPRGKMRLIEHPLFNTNADWAKMAVAVDLPTFRLAYLQGRKTQNMEFNTSGNQAADNGIDAIGGTLTTECTTLVKNTPANAVIRNLTVAAVG